MTQLYIPKEHDPILKLYHQMGYSDHKAALCFHSEHALWFTSNQCKRARLRLGLKQPKNGNHEVKTEFRLKLNPLVMAQAWLGKRLVEKPAGYFLDGTPADTTKIMKETNRLRLEAGQKPIENNPKWSV